MSVCEDRRVERVVRAVEGDLMKRQTLTDAAGVAGLRPAYFSKLFRRVTGETFVEWNARIRVTEAKKLLRILDLSVTAIAISVGYADVTTFERAFRKLEHRSPRQYRAKGREGAKARNAELRERNADLRTRNAETFHSILGSVGYGPLRRRESSLAVLCSDYTAFFRYRRGV
jgi:AraC-like DNA-binding protein